MVRVHCMRWGAMAVMWGTTFAQTAPGFPIHVSETLDVAYGANMVSPAGELIPRSDALNPPEISTTTFPSTGRAVLLMVDSDVPRNGTRVEILHWLVSGVTLVEGNSSALNIPSVGEAFYLAPNPPPQDIPHHYTFMLFTQEDETFSVPEQFEALLQTRIFFNTSAFVEAAGLTPIAANYMRVQNLTGTPTVSYPPPRATNETASTSSPVEFPGGASAMTLEGRMAWIWSVASLATGLAAFLL